MYPSVHLGYTSPPLPLHSFSPPPKKKGSLESFLKSLLPSNSRCLSSLLCSGWMFHIFVCLKTLPIKDFFSILIKVEQLSLPKRISEVTDVTFFAPPVSISIMLSNVLDVALPVTIRLTISLNERTSIRQSEVY